MNDAEATATATKLLEVVNIDIPSVSLGAVKTKYNVDEKMTISGFVEVVDGDVNAKWYSTSYLGVDANGEDLAIEDISLTPQSYQLSDGSHVVQLSIGKNMLVERSIIRLELRARYTSSMSNTKAIAAVAITMNEAPTGGDLKVMPTTGVALNTTFFFQTSGWDDDVMTSHCLMSFAYYVSRPYEQLVVKTSDELTYGEASLGQGRSGTGMIVCVGNASDIYGAQGTVTNNDVTVFPVENLIELRTLASSFMEQALIDKDATSLNNVATAVTSSLNAANCSSLPFVCADLNREECNEIDGTDHTCGPCLAGFTGIPGDSNIACGSTDLRRRRQLKTSLMQERDKRIESLYQKQRDLLSRGD